MRNDCRNSAYSIRNQHSNRRMDFTIFWRIYGHVCGRMDYGACRNRKCISGILQKTGNHKGNKLDRDIFGDRKDFGESAALLYEMGERMKFYGIKMNQVRVKTKQDRMKSKTRMHQKTKHDRMKSEEKEMKKRN